MIFFILNPKSGNKSNMLLGEMMEKLKEVPNSELRVTSRMGEAADFSKEIIQQKPDRIIAIGGDGTINEVASGMLYSGIPLGIVPSGSGNGLAGHMKLSSNFDKALQQALHGNIHTMDAAYFNDKPFFCTAGIGFDAAVAHHFAKSTHRGFLNYVRSTIITLLGYKDIRISILKDSKIEEEKVFSSTWANANQYGNNAIISPFSEIGDGKIEWIMIRPLHLMQIFILPLQLFSGKLHNNNFVRISSIEEMEIKYESNRPYHLDGEIFMTDRDHIQIKIAKGAMKVIY
ncbi:MAG: diacylglycerol/lipid kinase family protein [Chitinophagaceae bacterium]